MCDMTADEFRQVVDVDLNAPFIVSKAVIPVSYTHLDVYKRQKKTLNNNKRRTAYDSFIYNISRRGC